MHASSADRCCDEQSSGNSIRPTLMLSRSIMRSARAVVFACATCQPHAARNLVSISSGLAETQSTVRSISCGVTVVVMLPPVRCSVHACWVRQRMLQTEQLGRDWAVPADLSMARCASPEAADEIRRSMACRIICSYELSIFIFVSSPVDTTVGVFPAGSLYCALCDAWAKDRSKYLDLPIRANLDAEIDHARPPPRS